LTIMALYFECRINKNAPSDCLFGDFAHWLTIVQYTIQWHLSLTKRGEDTFSNLTTTKKADESLYQMVFNSIQPTNVHQNITAEEINAEIRANCNVLCVM